MALPAPSAGVTPGNAASPVVYSVSPATIPQAASTNDLPIPAGASAASTNESTSKINDPKRISSVNDTPLSNTNPPVQASACGTSPSPSPFDCPVKSGIKLNAAAGTKARPANNTIFTGDTSSNPGLSTTKVKGSKKRQREKKKKNLTTDDGIMAPPVRAPTVYQEYDGLNVFTAEEDRAYKYAQKLKETNYFHPTYTSAIGPEAAPTPDGSEPSTSTPRTRSRRLTPPPPPMSWLAKEAAKNARNTPKAVKTSLAPLPLPQVVEAEQASTTGIPPVPDPLEPTILPQDIKTAGVHTPEPTISPLEAVSPAQVPLTSAQTTAANTTRNLALKAARLFSYRQELFRVNPNRLDSEVANSAARASITTRITRSQHVRLRERNLAALSYAARKLSTFKATTLKDARILAIHVSAACRVSQTAPSVLRTSVVQELNSHLLCVTEDRLAPFSLKKLFHHLSQMAPLSPNLGKPGLAAKKPTRKRMQAPDPIRLYRAAKRHVKAAALNFNHLLETQKRLTATKKDGPFMDPESPPPVLAVPFVPPSWAAAITGGYRHNHIRRHLHLNHKPHPRPSRKETGKKRRTNRRKAIRSCAGPEPGPRANRRKNPRT